MCITTEPIIAKHGGTCPLCGRYIVKGRSKILALEQPIRPQPPAVYEDWTNHDNGRRLERPVWRWARGGGAHHADMRPRAWIHASCAPKLRKLALEEATV
jgi:hypothetical protein